MRKKIFTGFVVLSALLYVFVLYRLLFVGFGRANVMMSADMQMQYAYNLIPFKTIAEYVAGFGSGHASMNLIGNLLLLVPLGFYLPFFIDKMRKLWLYAIIVAITIIIIEVVQLVTFSGSLDIDDFLLNFIGALIGYLVFTRSPIRAIFKLRAY